MTDDRTGTETTVDAQIERLISDATSEPRRVLAQAPREALDRD